MNNRKHTMRNYTPVLIVLACIIFIAVLLERVYNQFGFDPMVILDYLLPSVAFFFAVWAVLVCLASCFRLIKLNFVPLIVRSALCLGVVCVIISLPVQAAHYHLVQNTLDWVEEQISGTDSDDEPQPPAEESTEPAAGTPAVPSLVWPEEPTEDPAQEGFLVDPDREYQLSSDEVNRLFFTDKLTRTTKKADIRRAVVVLSEFVSGCSAQNRPNEFDRKADKDLMGHVSNASSLESDMLKSHYVGYTSADLEYVITSRTTAFNSNPCYSLAWLIANNQQTYAEKYAEINGAFSTIEYYYGYSIFWFYECLTFDEVDDYAEKTLISSLKNRYKDIAYYAPEGSDSKYWASVFYEAFELLEETGVY